MTKIEIGKRYKFKINYHHSTIERCVVIPNKPYRCGRVILADHAGYNLTLISDCKDDYISFDAIIVAEVNNINKYDDLHVIFIKPDYKIIDIKQ